MGWHVRENEGRQMCTEVGSRGGGGVETQTLEVGSLAQMLG